MASTVPATMRAARIHHYGEPGAIRYETVPVPAPGRDEVLVQVAASAFNPTETAIRSGRVRDVFPLTLPYTFGWDVAGTIVGVGDDVGGWSPGDRVIARVDAGGAAAQYAAAPADVIVEAPRTVPLTDAAALPVAGLTAWQAVCDHANVCPGQRVLINGAGGGVGGFAVQLAKSAGAHVIATASARSADAVRAAGADQIVDYTSQAVPDSLDVVINLVAIPPDAAASLATRLRAGGVAVSIATPLPVTDAVHFVTRNDREQLAKLVVLIDAGELAVDVAEVVPQRELASVHRRNEAGRTRGKIVLVP